MTNTNYYRWAAAIALFLLIPLSLSLLSVGGWGWTFFDYIAGFVLLFAAASVFEYLRQRTQNTKKRWYIGLAILALVLIVWTQMAVGAVSQLLTYIFS